MQVMLTILLAFVAKWFVLELVGGINSYLWLIITTLTGITIHLAFTYNRVLLANEQYTADRSITFVRESILRLILIAVIVLVWVVAYIDNWIWVSIIQFIDGILYLVLLGSVSMWGLIRGSGNALRRMEAINQINNRPP